ncbi:MULTISPECIES: hypothetical protein [Dehalococcoides]|uniref:Uncharacterized protein n=1 Tax=Dehalococcoides mccartyi TaxID=61435 RepID=A0AB38Z8N8_9CHLR|nr:hypothetical protein [Dehalococcoides mccartyi]OBW61633.1 MAG: hypothetical protein A9181_01115 [Dehalococcoides mccartyi]WRO06862.1 hypothetical protein VLL09_05600 [Dehalococcoides mccartyi]
MVEIPEEIVEYFGSSNVPIRWLVPQTLAQEGYFGDILRKFSDEIKLENIPQGDAAPIWAKQLECLDRADLKLEVTIQVIGDAVAAKRMQSLRNDPSQCKVKPYDNPELVGICLDSNGLVELDHFRYNDHFFPGLNRSNTVFEVVPPIAKSISSMHWALSQLKDIAVTTKIKVRLDPLLVHDAKAYHPILFKMLVWGKPLDWNSLAGLQQEEHSRWMPGPYCQEEVEFTDLVWSPRDDGIHFICEEVPKLEVCEIRASRYFHGIFVPATRTFIHCDGAIRIYEREELISRHRAHVRRIGKIGKRVKIFEVGGKISTEQWTNLVCAYFVWNNDLQNYFGAGIEYKV